MNDPALDRERWAAAVTRPLKLHLRIIDVGRTTYRVASLRPANRIRFSTNFFHDTWHILSSPGGAFLLGRLLWGLAFQRERGTVVLIDDPHLAPTPFDGDPADPILLVPDGLSGANLDDLRRLRHLLPRHRTPTRTIRWHTFGMASPDAARDRWLRPEEEHLVEREQMSRRAGFLCYTAPPEILRLQALGLQRLRTTRGENYFELAAADRGDSWRVDGEVQIFSSFARDVIAATAARRELLGDPALPIPSDTTRDAIHARRNAILDRRRNR
jgi:hypothetical protein